MLENDVLVINGKRYVRSDILASDTHVYKVEVREVRPIYTKCVSLHPSGIVRDEQRCNISVVFEEHPKPPRFSPGQKLYICLEGKS